MSPAGIYNCCTKGGANVNQLPMETKGIDVARFGTLSVKYLYVILPASDVDSSCAHVFPFPLS